MLKFGLWKVRVEEEPFKLEYFGTEEGCVNWFEFNKLTILSKELIFPIERKELE